VILETCGGQRQVLKLLPPLNMPEEVLQEALGILCRSVHEALSGGAA
jgi:4-aminobutyrate aminotransferase-like enzyme